MATFEISFEPPRYTRKRIVKIPVIRSKWIPEDELEE